MIYLWIWHGDAVRVNWRNYNWIFLISQDCMSMISMYKPTQGTLDKEATFKSILPILYDLCLRASSLLTPSFRQVVYKRQKSVAVYRSDFPSSGSRAVMAWSIRNDLEGILPPMYLRGSGSLCSLGGARTLPPATAKNQQSKSRSNPSIFTGQIFTWPIMLALLRAWLRAWSLRTDSWTHCLVMSH